MRIRPSRRAVPAAGTMAAVATVAGLLGLVGLTAGCGTDTNPAADPSAHSGQAADKFDPFPEPSTWNLSVGPTYWRSLGR